MVSGGDDGIAASAGGQASGSGISINIIWHGKKRK